MPPAACRLYQSSSIQRTDGRASWRPGARTQRAAVESGAGLQGCRAAGLHMRSPRLDTKDGRALGRALRRVMPLAAALGYREK